MQDLSSMAFQSMNNPQFPEHEKLKCPRCDSTNTKFCYYNNYNLSQPRHFCKNCRRYWTKGGALRNIPVGGGTRKNNSSSSNNNNNNNKRNPTNAKRSNPDPKPEPERIVRQELDGSLKSGQDEKVVVEVVGGSNSFSSLLMENGEFRSLFDGLSPNGPALKPVQLGGFDHEVLNSGLVKGSVSNVEDSGNDGKNSGDNIINDGGGYLESDDLNIGGSSTGWSDLAVYTTTPGSGFQLSE